jgi:hypothetical protein
MVRAWAFGLTHPVWVSRVRCREAYGSPDRADYRFVRFRRRRQVGHSRHHRAPHRLSLCQWGTLALSPTRHEIPEPRWTLQANRLAERGRHTVPATWPIGMASAGLQNGHVGRRRCGAGKVGRAARPASNQAVPSSTARSDRQSWPSAGSPPASARGQADSRRGASWLWQEHPAGIMAPG